MANLARSVFGEGLPWSMVGAGAVLAVSVILFDQRQKARKAAFRVPVLAVALGIYLPLKLSAAILIGGIIAALAEQTSIQGQRELARSGLLFAAGLVTGEALMGIFLALPIALNSVWPFVNADPFTLFVQPPLGAWPGVIVIGVVALLLYRAAKQYSAIVNRHS
jgi:uncharacterized oligopeptide transporter (OPT) family protein